MTGDKILQLDQQEAKTIYSALLIAHETLTEGLKEPLVIKEYTPKALAELEEKAMAFADLIERFKGYAP